MGRRVQSCECCGRPGEGRRVQPLRVEPVSTAPAVGTLALCSDCRSRQDRTWRLRWTEAPVV
jgi:hypothetical protein